MSKQRSPSKGFTLLELVMVMVLLGVMAVGITSFVSLTTQTYVNVSARDELIASARFVVERLNREIRNAVPNSVRVKSGTFAGIDIQCLEFAPIVASTIYTDIPVAPDPLSDTLTVIEFNGQDGNDYQCAGFCLDSVAVYPLTPDDIFANQTDATGKVFGLKSVTQTTPAEWTLTLDRASGVSFDADSPTERLYITRSPVSFCVADNRMFRYENYAFTANQLTPPFAPAVTMADNLDNMNTGDLPFTLLPATLQRNAMVQVKLNFLLNDESIVFNNEIHIANVP